MIKFAQNTPSAARSWLQQTIAETSAYQNAVLLSLAQDERMTDFWGEVRQWPPSVVQWLLENAALFGQERMCDIMAGPPGRRIGLAWPQYELYVTGDSFADAIERNLTEAADLLGNQDVAELAQNVRTFSKLALQKAEVLRSQFDNIPEISTQGPQKLKGNRRRLAFRLVISEELATLAAAIPALLTKPYAFASGEINML